MSSVHRLQGKPNWFCFFRDGLGERRCRSTGCTDRKHATKVCMTFDRAGELAGMAELTPDRGRKLVEDLLKELTDRHQERPLQPRRIKKVRRLLEGTINEILRDVESQLPTRYTAQEFFESWIKQCEKELSESTWKRYVGIKQAFLKFLGPGQKKALQSIRPADLQKYRDALAECVSSGTVNTHLKVLRVAFGAAAKSEIISSNPAKVVETLGREDRHRRRAFTMVELQKLFLVAATDWQTMILAGVYTGLRLQDCANLTAENLDLVQEELTMTTGKTGRTVILPIAKPLLHHIESLPAGDDPKGPLCPTLYGQSSSWLSNQFHELMASAGLVASRRATTKDTRRQIKKKGRGNRRDLTDISFHALRHTATSLLKNAGVSDVIARDIIGHESVAISRNYTHIDTATKRKAVNLMPDVARMLKQPELNL